MRIDLAGITGSAGVPPAGPTKTGGPSKELRDLEKACEQFEAVFANRLLAEMRKGIKDSALDGVPGGEIYRDMMDQAVADAIAHRGELGIAKILYRQLSERIPPADGNSTNSSNNTESTDQRRKP